MPNINQLLIYLIFLLLFISDSDAVDWMSELSMYWEHICRARNNVSGIKYLQENISLCKSISQCALHVTLITKEVYI